MKTQYAIETIKGNMTAWDYYPDPLYTDLQRATDKVEYLKNYEVEHGMELSDYRIKALTPEEAEEHTRQWRQWCSMID